jgi:hypothetical protein
MKQFIIIFLIGLAGCSSRNEFSLNDEMKGRYLFNLKLKQSYTDFIVHQVFKNGQDLYAGPAFIQFNNWQPIILATIAPSDAISTVYVSKDGSKLEYLEHHLRSFDQVKYRIPFVSVFKALGQNEKHSFDIVMTLKCKKEFECTYHPATDFLKHGDPYDFHFESLDTDFFSTEVVNMGQFSSTERTAISNRSIFPGMGQKAAEISIGHQAKHYIHGYYNVKFKNGIVQDFEFRFRDDLHFFNRN